MAIAAPQVALPVGLAAEGRRSRFHRLGGRGWSQEIESSAAALTLRVATIRQRPPVHGTTEAERDAICAGVAVLVQGALDAARGTDPAYRSPLSWWRGTSVEAAFRKSHQAEVELLRLYSDAEVDAEVPVALGRAEVSLHREDPLREVARHLLLMHSGAHKRLLLSKVVQAGHEAADGAHSRLRNFRNVVLTTAFCITALVLVFSIVVAIRPSMVPLCFRPTGFVACPTGAAPGRQPTPLDVVVVAMLGLLGGSLAAAVSIRNLRGTETPYDVPIALAMLKVPAGALTAIGALVAIRGEFVPGLSALDTQEQILAYALLFGYAQQLLTGLIDKQARSLLSAVPSKDPEQGRAPLHSLAPSAEQVLAQFGGPAEAQGAGPSADQGAGQAAPAAPAAPAVRSLRVQVHRRGRRGSEPPSAAGTHPTT
jgi:hypothetical protein